MKASILAFGWMVLLVNTAAARPDEDRLKLLSRGVNLSHWFAQSTSQYNADRIASFVSDEEIKRIRAAGFLHVRVGVEPAIVGDDSIMTLLKSKIEKLMASDLAVVVDLHPVGDYKEKYRTDTGRAELIRTWESLIAKLVKFDPGRLFIEVMNEPFPIEGTEWQKLQSDAVQAIRRKAPKHTIVVNSGGWSGIDDIVAMTPLDDPNIVYTAHWYGPLLFTHQAADWTWEMVRRVKAVDWPIDRGAANAMAHGMASDREAETTLHYEISGGQFEATFLDGKLDKLAEWQKRNGNAAIYIGEFGVYGLQAPRPSMLSWTRAARTAYEKYDFGWSYWDYSPSFGLVSTGPGGRTFNADMLSALGLGAK